MFVDVCLWLCVRCYACGCVCGCVFVVVCLLLCVCCCVFVVVFVEVFVVVCSGLRFLAGSLMT